MTGRIDAVILDLDGTLLDHTASVTTGLPRWLPTLGQAATDDLVSAWLAAEERHLPAWRSRSISFAEQRRRRLRDFLPLIGIEPGRESDLDLLFAGYLRQYEAAWTTFDDVDGALESMAELRVITAVLSNGTDDQQNAKRRAIGIDGRVGPVFTAEGLGVAKPDPASYRTVCDRLGVDPRHALHVGDRYDLDVRAARAAGLQAVHLDRTGGGPVGGPGRITSLRDLRRYVTEF